MDEAQYMERAIALARPHRTHPNPRVGCVIVRDGVVVGEGAHLADGGPHAETHALGDAGPQARDATVYVTLEPCSHVGRTPACAQSLIDAGVARVVIATLDPDPRVSGSGVRMLRDAGVVVDVGLSAESAVELDRAYHHHRRTGRPLVVGLLGPIGVDDTDVDAVDVLDEAAPVEPQLDALGERGVVSVGVSDPGLVARLTAENMLDEVVVAAGTDMPDWLGKFVTVAGPDTIQGHTSVRKAEHVHRDH